MAGSTRVQDNFRLATTLKLYAYGGCIGPMRLGVRRKQTLEIRTYIPEDGNARSQPKRMPIELANYVDVGLTVPSPSSRLVDWGGASSSQKRAAQTALRTVMSRTVFALAAE